MTKIQINCIQHSSKDRPNYASYALIPCALLLIGFCIFPIGVQVPPKLIFAFAVFAVCILVTATTCMLVSFAKDKTYSKTLDSIREWVEINLNQKYQNQHGIRWNISQERRGATTYIHIVVQCDDTLEDEIVIQTPNYHVIQVYNANPAI